MFGCYVNIYSPKLHRQTRQVNPVRKAKPDTFTILLFVVCGLVHMVLWLVFPRAFSSNFIEYCKLVTLVCSFCLILSIVGRMYDELWILRKTKDDISAADAISGDAVGADAICGDAVGVDAITVNAITVDAITTQRT